MKYFKMIARGLLVSMYTILIIELTLLSMAGLFAFFTYLQG